MPTPTTIGPTTCTRASACGGYSYRLFRGHLHLNSPLCHRVLSGAAARLWHAELDCADEEGYAIAPIVVRALADCD